MNAPHRSVRCLLAASLLGSVLFWIPLAMAAPREPVVEVIDGVRHVRNGAEPLLGERTLRLEEVWRVNVEDEDELIGYISDALAGPDGTVWLADQQLGQVLVYSAEGVHLRTVGHEGEGPGEVNDPQQLLWLPGGGLGIRDRKPGQLTVIDQEGLPLSSVHLTALDGEPLSASFISAARCRDGVLAAAGTIFRQDDGAPIQVRFFSIFDGEGHERRRLLEAPSGFDFQNRSYDEPKNWFVDQGNFDVGPDGRVCCAVARDDYRIHVHDAAGALVQVIERAYEPRRRSAEEMESVSGGATMMINGEIVKLRTTVADFWPAIGSLRVDDDGRLWVAAGSSWGDGPEGIVGTYDIFDADGRYVEVVHVAADLDDERDQLQPLDDGRWIVLKNVVALRNAMYGARNGDEAETADTEDQPLEIVCLRPAGGG